MLLRVCYHYPTRTRSIPYHGLYLLRPKVPRCRTWVRVCGCEPLPHTGGGCYIYGHLRRTDFLPAGGEGAEEVLERGYDSLSDDDEDGKGLEYAVEGNGTVFDCEVDIADLANDDEDDHDFA